MRKLRLVLAAVALSLSPLAWASTIAPPANPIHGHDDSGKEVTLASNALSVPVAEAHVGLIVAEKDDRTRHIQQLVRVYAYGPGANQIHAECWAKNDGGAHDHSHKITACRLNDNVGHVWTGGCDIAGSYGPCGYSMQDQHWHSQSATLVDGRCYQAGGGFDTVGHTHNTVWAPGQYTWVCY
jgi:hypothetical protein